MKNFLYFFNFGSEVTLFFYSIIFQFFGIKNMLNFSLISIYYNYFVFLNSNILYFFFFFFFFFFFGKNRWPKIGSFRFVLALYSKLLIKILFCGILRNDLYVQRRKVNKASFFVFVSARSIHYYHIYIYILSIKLLP